MNDLKAYKWLLLPGCLVVGLALMVTFVEISQNYLSDYLIQNSKDHVGKKLDPEKLADLIGMPEVAQSPAPSVLVLWSVTCAPCLEKLKKLPDVGREGQYKDVRIIPVNTDPEDTLTQAKKTLAEYLPQQAFYHDKGKTLVTQLEVEYLPTNVYINAEGVIEKITAGARETAF